MKRWIISGDNSGDDSTDGYWSRSELDAAVTLRDLHIVGLQENLHSCCFLPWGAKRKRSAPAVNSNPRISSSSSVKAKAKVARRSPSTPLSFPTNDSDETKIKSYQKIVFKFDGRRVERDSLKKMSNAQVKAIKNKEIDRQKLRLVTGRNEVVRSSSRSQISGLTPLSGDSASSPSAVEDHGSEISRLGDVTVRANVEDVVGDFLQPCSQEEMRIRAYLARKERMEIQRKKKMIKLA